MRRSWVRCMQKGPLFVFLEGAAATGKSSICTELAARGHQVHFESFVELCDLHPQYVPGQLIMSFKWANDIIARMEEFSRSSHSVVFFDRSPLTPFVFARAHRDKLAIYPSLMDELKQSYHCSVVRLFSAEEIILQRLRERYDRSTEAEKAIRRSLNELDEDFVREINSRYDALAEAGAFEHHFDTGAETVQQATQSLLNMVKAERRHKD